MLGYPEAHLEVDPDPFAATLADILLGGICRER